ncbi:MAG: tetratricopeptide repeat protein [Planctomycetes bacterium]|nr:tetratricopeptide repeat protein [Planctomycetota bacterium]
MSDTTAPAGASPAPAAAAPGRGWNLVAPLFLALLSVALYLPTLDYRLVYDDDFLIRNNESMTPVASDFGAAFALFTQEYWDGVNPDKVVALKMRGQALYRPLTLFAWACIVAAQGGVGATWPYHALNIAANAAAVVLLYLLVRRLFGSARTAFAAALLFAVHPLHGEAVAYVAGLSDVLSGLTVLAGLLLWERATREAGRLHMPAYIALLATLFIGLLAKEGAVVLVAAVALADVTLALSGRNRGGWPRVSVYGGLLLVLALHLAVRLAAVGYLEPSSSAISRLDNPLIEEPFGIRLINGTRMLAFQAWLFLWPETLSIDYSFNAIPLSRSWSQAEPLAAGVLVAVLLVYGLAMLRRRPALGFGVLLFLGAATFTSNILVPIGTFFGERLTYLPSAGLCLAVAAALDVVLRDRRPGAGPHAMSAPGLVLLLAAGGLLGARTVEHNRVFETSEKLFESALEAVPQSARVPYQMGALLGNQGLYTKAEELYTRALTIDPTFIQAALGLGDVFAASKNWDKALDVYDRILKQLATTTAQSQATLDEVTRMVYLKRGNARAGKGDFAGFDADMRAAMQVQSGEDVRVDPHLLLARTLRYRGKPEEAIPVLRQALAIKPDAFLAQYELALSARQAQDPEAYDQAVVALDQDARGKPYSLILRAERLWDEAQQDADDRKRAEALELFEQARALAPDQPNPYVFRGLYLLEKGRFLDAILELDRALEKAPRLPTALRLKAMAQNQAGRPKEALDTARELELVSPDAGCYTLMFRSHFLLGNLPEMEAAAAKLSEKGAAAETVILDLSIALRNAGRVDDAIAAVESGRLLPGLAQHPDLLHNLALLLIEARRCDEALATLDQLTGVQAALPGGAPEPILLVHRARALMCLDRDVEAAATLEAYEQEVTPESPAWLPLAQRRAELFLKAGSPFFDPQAASELAERGVLVSKGTHPGVLDVSLAALAAVRDFPAARARADQAARTFPNQVRYQVAARALQFAADGDVPACIETLRKADDALLSRIAAQLEG